MVYATNEDGVVNTFYRSSAYCDTLSLDNACEYFAKCVRELKFAHVWMIADFEKSSKKRTRLFKKEEPVGVIGEDENVMSISFFNSGDKVFTTWIHGLPTFHNDGNTDFFEEIFNALTSGNTNHRIFDFFT